MFCNLEIGFARGGGGGGAGAGGGGAGGFKLMQPGETFLTTF